MAHRIKAYRGHFSILTESLFGLKSAAAVIVLFVVVVVGVVVVDDTEPTTASESNPRFR